MARQHAGQWDQWTPPQGASGDGSGAGSLDNRLIRDLVAALGASVLNTNNNIVTLGQMMVNNQNNNGDHGYRLLKLKNKLLKPLLKALWS